MTDLAADARASTLSVAARLVVPDADELRERLSQTRRQLQRAPLHLLERKRPASKARTDDSARSPRATLERGYAIVRDRGRIVRAGAELTAGTRVDVELGQGGFNARRGDAMNFEEAQRELEQIVQQLESGQANLDDAIKLWERGQELHRFCVDQLDFRRRARLKHDSHATW